MSKTRTEPAARPEGPDVSQLGSTEIPEGAFPGGRNQPFRVYFAPEVHDRLWTHARGDVSVEVCGVLVGRWGRDGDGPYVAISESIRGEAAENKFAEVTFTHETWARINQQMDTQFAHLAIVGWYHTHPDFGIFLSDRDRFIQEHFFSGPGQVAHVLDPVRGREGVFIWKSGTPVLAPSFWVVDRLIAASPEGAEARTRSRSEPNSGGTGAPSAPAPPGGSAVAPFSALQLVLCLILVLLGYGLGTLRNLFDTWDRQRLIEGVVAHYGLWNGLRPGLRDDLEQLRKDVNTLATITATLGEDHLQRLGPKADTLRDSWDKVRLQFTHAGEQIERLEDQYCPTAEEARAMRDYILSRVEAVGAIPRTTRPEEPSKPAAQPAPEAAGKASSPAPPAKESNR